MEITIGQIISFISIMAGVVGGVSAICAAINKVVSKKINNEISSAIAPVNTALNEIKQQNTELKEQGQDTRKEIILIMKLNQAMITELKQLGHINGETSQALQDLNDYLISR